MIEALTRALLVVVVACLLCAASAQIGFGKRENGAPVINCVSRGEYLALDVGLALSQVRFLFDLPGRLELDPPTPNYDKYSFRTCPAWEAANGKRVWCWFSVFDGFLVKWALRDDPATLSSTNSEKGGNW